MEKNNITDKLLAGNFEKSRSAVNQLSDPLVPTPMVLTLDQIRHYELNPRVKKNPKYEELKNSILMRGFNAVPPVTRRPDQEHFILRDGFNTRLSILNELWKETKDEKYFKVLCQFYPWDKEIKVLTGHLSENDLHGDLTFIERALGVQRAKKIYEEEAGRELSQREIAKLLTEDGYPIKQAQVQRLQDTVDFLLPIIPNALYSGMGSYQTQKLIILRRQTKSIFQKYTNASDERYIQLFTDVLGMFDDAAASFNFKRFHDELIGQMSVTLNKTYNLIALEFEDKVEAEETNEKDLSTVEIDEVELLSKPLNLLELSEQEIINMPMPEILRSKEPKLDEKLEIVTTPEVNDNFANFNNGESFDVDNETDENDEGFDDEQISVEPSNQIPTSQQTDSKHLPADKPVVIADSPKLEAIKNIIAQATSGNESTSEQPVPTTSGFFPVKDIWQITSDLQDISRLQQHIGQLAYEIANEVNLGNSIELTENNFGYICIKSANNEEDTLLNILNDLSQPSKLSALLLGNFKQFDNISRLSDESLIKLFRIIRLSRELLELEKTN